MALFPIKSINSLNSSKNILIWNLSWALGPIIYDQQSSNSICEWIVLIIFEYQVFQKLLARSHSSYFEILLDSIIQDILWNAICMIAQALFVSTVNLYFVFDSTKLYMNL